MNSQARAVHEVQYVNVLLREAHKRIMALPPGPDEDATQAEVDNYYRQLDTARYHAAWIKNSLPYIAPPIHMPRS